LGGARAGISTALRPAIISACSLVEETEAETAAAAALAVAVAVLLDDKATGAPPLRSIAAASRD